MGAVNEVSGAGSFSRLCGEVHIMRRKMKKEIFLMRIHRVERGESVFGIARLYGVPAASIIEVNGLENPDALSVGQELLILTPRRVYTARSGDTVAGVARRFGMKKEELYAANPSLLYEDRLYDGQVLALGYGDARLGMAASCGYVFSGCSEEAIMRALPYLTYLTVAAIAVRGDKVERLFDGERVVKIAKEHGILVHTDAVQAMGAIDINVAELGVDMLSFSAHKFNGPKGMGALYIKNGIPMARLIAGGHQERTRRGGTTNVPGVVGFAEALKLTKETMKEDTAYVASLRDRFIKRVEEEIQADFILFNTCAIRENAENRIFGELGRIKKIKSCFACWSTLFNNGFM